MALHIVPSLFLDLVFWVIYFYLLIIKEILNSYLYLQVENGKCVSRVMLRIFENSVGESIELISPKFYCVKEEDPIEYI